MLLLRRGRLGSMSHVDTDAVMHLVDLAQQPLVAALQHTLWVAQQPALDHVQTAAQVKKPGVQGIVVHIELCWVREQLAPG